MNPRQRTVALCDKAAAEKFAPFRALSCGRCGQTFASKGDKARHKRQCGRPAVEPVEAKPKPQPITDADYTAPEDRYVDMRRHITPRIRAIANAEWAAMDAEGRLPADWPERLAQIEAQFAEGTPA